MAYVALDRTERAVAFTDREALERIDKSLDFDRVTQLRSRSVGLYQLVLPVAKKRGIVGTARGFR